jgi:hypothetical protein
VAPVRAVVHFFAQVPQLLSSLWRSTQTLLQIESPAVVHDCAHEVPLHDTVPPVGAVHFVHEGPHALTSLATQVPPHRCVPPVHWQTLAMHC